MIRVLLVDDHRIVRDGIKGMLVNEPSIEVVGEASSGAEWVRCSRGLRCPYSQTDTGSKKEMPKFGRILSDEQIDMVVAYLREVQGAG